MATTNVRYVDPDSAGGDGTTPYLDQGTAAYITLNAWEAARDDVGDLVARNTIEECICDSNGALHTADGTAVNLLGWTTGVNNYIDIHTPAGSRHAGVYDTTKYRLEVAVEAGGRVLNFTEDYTRVDGLQFYETADGNAKDGLALTVTVTSGDNETRISNCIVRGPAAAGTGYHRSIYCSGNNANINVRNCILYGGNTNDATGAIVGSASVTGCTIKAYSITAKANGKYIFFGGGATMNLKNCYGGGSVGTGHVDYLVTGTTTCASSDTSADVDSIAVNTTNFTNVTEGTEDFRLPSGSGLIGVGTDTSGDSAPFNFTTDIRGRTRTATWDIGADEYIAAVGRAGSLIHGKLLRGGLLLRGVL